MRIETRTIGPAEGLACVALVSCLLGACAPSPSVEPPPVRIASMQEFMGVRFPLEAGPYSAMSVRRYLDPSLGISIGYVALESKDQVDIYVYPAAFTRDQSEEPLDADSGLQEEFKRARAELRNWAFERRGATGVRSASDTTIQIALGADTVQGMWGDFEIVRDEQSYLSSLVVFLKDSSFVKARHSAATDDFETSTEATMDLLREFLGSVRP